jgi:cytidylate kinase
MVGCPCSGKTTLARYIIEKNGGIKSEQDGFTVTHNEVVLAGKYSSVAYPGFDRMQVFAKPNFECKTLIYEGTSMARFNSEKIDFLIENNGTVIFLYAPLAVINSRLIERSGERKRKHLISDIRAVNQYVKKIKEVGLRLLLFDTSKYDTEQIYNEISYLL